MNPTKAIVFVVSFVVMFDAAASAVNLLLPTDEVKKLLGE